MQFDPLQIDPQLAYKLLASVVVPRPIAWTSTVDADGNPNLAPFSFFMMITSSPPHVAISIGARNGLEKDTLRNIRATGELVINTVSVPQQQEMAMTSAEWPAEVNEFEVAGLRLEPSEVVRPPRVSGAPANLECLVRDIMPVGGAPYGAHLVICEVVRLHLRDDLVQPNNRIDLQAMQAVGRLTGDWYCATDQQYELRKPLLRRND